MIIDAAPRRIIVIDEEEGIVVCSLVAIPRYVDYEEDDKDGVVS